MTTEESARAALAEADAAGMLLVRENERLRHDLSWHYGEVERLRTVMRRALNAFINPRWPGDPDPIVEVVHLLDDALKANSTVGKY